MHWWPHAIDFMSQSRSSLCCSFDFFKGNRAKRWKSGKTSKYHELGMFCTDFFTTFDLPPTDQFMHSSFLKLCRNGENTLLEIWCASFDLSTFKRKKTIFLSSLSVYEIWNSSYYILTRKLDKLFELISLEHTFKNSYQTMVLSKISITCILWYEFLNNLDAQWFWQIIVTKKLVK